MYLKEQDQSGGWWSQLKNNPMSLDKMDKAYDLQISFFPGDGKSSSEGQKSCSLQSSMPDNHASFDFGFTQPLICTNYPYGEQCFGVFSGYGPQIPGRIMLPINVASDDGPIYVNAKQYHGIMRRRKSRAKAVLQNKLTKKRKPYMHYSRHLHAMRRPRGCGGRFLNTKSQEDVEMEKKKSGSQTSEVVQSDAGYCKVNGSEVTSIYSTHFSMNQWVAAAAAAAAAATLK